MREYPLSENQKPLWSHYKAFPQSTVYILHYIGRFISDFHADGYELAVNEMIKMHPVFRTTFFEKNGVPFQKIHPKSFVHLPVTDARTWSTERYEEFLRNISDTPFVLENEFPYRIHVIRTDAGYVFSYCMHHIITDFLSFTYTFRQIGDFYSEWLKTGHIIPVNQKEYPPDYCEYVAWQKEYLHSSKGIKDRAYWREQLTPVPRKISLPGETKTDTAISSHDIFRFVIDAQTTSRIDILAQESKTTVYIVLLSALYALFYRYSLQKYISIGTAALGRSQSFFYRTAGLFVNTLLLQSHIEDSDRFIDVIQNAHSIAFSGLRHQKFPFSVLVDDIMRENTSDPFSLLSAFFVYYTANRFADTSAVAMQERTLWKRDAAEFDVYPLHKNTSIFDFSLFAIERDEEIHMAIEYSHDVFEQSAIQRISAHLQTLLEEVSENPDMLIKNIRILPAEEEEEIRQLECDTGTRIKYRDINHWFETFVRTHPHHISVYDKEEWTAEEIHTMAAAVAYFLRETRGYKSASKIAVLLDRSAWATISLFGILRAGCVYVPLDPALPDERLRFMIHDSNTVCILTVSGYEDRLSNMGMADKTFVISSLNKNKAQLPPVRCQPDDSAYIIYTSGSTGRPKGVIQTHNCLSHLIQWQIKEIPSRLKILQYAAAGFDVSVQEILYGFLSGGTLFCIESDLRYDFEYVIDFCEMHKIECLILPFSAVRKLCKTTGFSRVDCIRHLITSGEKVVLFSALENYLRTHPDVTFYNQYGPTETHVVTSYTMHGGQDSYPLHPPIGIPVDGACVMIADANGMRCPRGVVGEIVVSGACVATGYNNDAEHTAASFTPLACEPDAIWYKTGDRGMWNEAGLLEYHGRTDEQVKIRGYRIECGEIEACLHNYDSIKHAAVVICEHEGEKHICAFYESAAPISEEKLHAFVAHTLPVYMLPSVYIHTTMMPRNANGKIDKNSLSLPDDAMCHTCRENALPASPLECSLHSIFSTVLHKPSDTIGIHDNFFFLGGNSLSAVQIINTIRAEMGYSLPVNALFTHPGIHSLASYISHRKTDDAVHIPRTQEREDNVYPASHSQKRMWVLEHISVTHNAYSMPAAYVLEGDFSADAFTRGIALLVKKHEALRTVFIQKENDVYQSVIPPDDDDYIQTMVSIRDDVSEDTYSDIMREEAYVPFDLEHGPLLRFTLYRISDTRTILLFNMHHIISDAWTLHLIVEQLFNMYSSLCCNEKPAVLPPARQYKDYAVWHNKRLLSHHMSAHQAYWKERLKGRNTTLSLPLDFPRPKELNFNGKCITHTLGKEVCAAIHEYAGKVKVSDFMVLLTSVKILLALYTLQDDIAVGIPVSGRDYPDTEEIVGLCVNTMISVDSFAAEDTLQHCVQSVAAHFNKDFVHREYPFDLLVDETRDKHLEGHSPLCDVIVNYIQHPLQNASLPGIHATPISEHFDTAKYDLTFHFVEKETIELSLEYRTDLFTGKTIETLIHHWENVLTAIITTPEKTVAETCLLSAKEIEHVLTAARGPYQPENCEYTLDEIFCSQVKKHGDSRALISDDTQWTYSELNETVQNLATALRDEHHIQKGDMIGVLLPRSPWVHIAFLAIVRCGAVYVPVDPTYPEKRIEFMLNDAGVKTVVTNPEVTLPESFESSRLNITDDWTYPGRQFTADIAPLDGAYMIYTSGSTGAPKGVLITHKGIVNTFISMQSQLAFSADDITIDFFSPSFDGAVLIHCCSLLSGTALVCVTDDDLRDATRFAQRVERYNVTCAIVSPSFLHAVGFDTFKSTRMLITGGEKALPYNGEWPENYPEYWNAYGPTENSIATTLFRIDTHPEENPIPIGYPLDNMECMILHHGRTIQPLGIPGEIAIGGAGLAREYWRRPELTESAFVPHPYRDNERLYLSGDKGILRPDGAVICHGRIDEQIKVRGFRIEPGEIEYALRQHTRVNNAYVTTMKRGDVDELIAYVACPQPHPQTEELLSYIKNILPAYMMPGSIVICDSFPLTKNAKIDVQALPRPSVSAAETNTPETTPENETQRIITNAFKDVLAITHVDIDSSFFEVGCNSLNVIMIHKKLIKQFPQLTVTDMFQYPTIRQLSAYVDRGESIAEAETITKNVVSRRTEYRQSRRRAVKQKIRTMYDTEK